MALQARPHEFDEDYIQDADRLLTHNKALRENIQAVSAIKQAIESEDYYSAYEVWSAIPESVQNALWVAPTQGGIFTTKEREIMKTGEFRQA